MTGCQGAQWTNKGEEMSEQSPKRLDVGIVVRDLQGMLTFYRDTLGLEYQGEQPMSTGVRHMFHCGDSHLKLVWPDVRPEESNPPGGSKGASGIRYITVASDDVEEMVERCRQAGGPIPTPLKKLPSGNTIAMVEDPDGNWVELLSPLGPRDDRPKG